jgi:hypothetical protein
MPPRRGFLFDAEQYPFLEGRSKKHQELAQILDLKICNPAAGPGAFLVEACRQLGDRLVPGGLHHQYVGAGVFGRHRLRVRFQIRPGIVATQNAQIQGNSWYFCFGWSF